jgi:hypothetical protein
MIRLTTRKRSNLKLRRKKAFKTTITIRIAKELLSEL